MGVFVRYQKFHTFCFYCIFWKIINGLPFICNLITFTPFVLNLREHQKALIYCFPVLGRNANFSFSSSRRILIHWSYTLKRKPPPAHHPPPGLYSSSHLYINLAIPCHHHFQPPPLLNQEVGQFNSIYPLHTFPNSSNILF